MAEKKVKMNRLKEVLVRLDISQNELAGKWGKSVEHVSRVCQQHNQPTLAGLREIASILNVNVLDLIEPTPVKKEE